MLRGPAATSYCCNGSASSLRHYYAPRHRCRPQMESIQSVVDILGCSSSAARVLLTFFRWDAEALFGAHAERGPEWVFRAANVTSRSTETPSVTGATCILPSSAKCTHRIVVSPCHHALFGNTSLLLNSCRSLFAGCGCKSSRIVHARLKYDTFAPQGTAARFCVARASAMCRGRRRQPWSAATLSATTAGGST